MTHPMVSTEPNRFLPEASGHSIHPQAAVAFGLPPIPSMEEQGLNSLAHDVWIYFAGSTALKAFLQPLGITAFKIGSTARRDIDDGIKDLRRKRYAGKLGVPGDPGKPAIELEKGDEWFQSPILPEYLGATRLPSCIAIENNALRVTIPRSITHTRFENALRALLANRSLDQYLATSEGCRRLSTAGYNPDQRLITDYTLIGAVRRSSATELYLIRVRKELPMLVKAISDLVAQL